VKRAAAYWLRRVADRIDRPGAPKAMHWRFTFERGEGIRFREDGRGCRLWYFDADYDQAYAQADNPVPRVAWEKLRAS
jgi:hypothetical protein